MKIKIVTLLAMLALSALVSSAQANTVMGSISCKQWLDRQNHPADGEAYTVWLMGYMSGANAIYGEMLDRDLLQNPDNVPVVPWTDAYCQKYPKAMLQDGAYALVKYLKRNLP